MSDGNQDWATMLERYRRRSSDPTLSNYHSVTTEYHVDKLVWCVDNISGVWWWEFSWTRWVFADGVATVTLVFEDPGDAVAFAVVHG